MTGDICRILMRSVTFREHREEVLLRLGSSAREWRYDGNGQKAQAAVDSCLFDVVPAQRQASTGQAGNLDVHINSGSQARRRFGRSGLM